jgi:hypothetical protein
MKSRITWLLLGLTLCAVGLVALGVMLPERGGPGGRAAVPTLEIPSNAKGPVIRPGRSSASPRAVDHAGTTDRADKTDETWQVIHLDGQRIGYAHSTVQTVADKGRTVVRTHTEIQMKFKRFGESVEMQKLLETEETERGDLLRPARRFHPEPRTRSTIAG